MVVTWWYCISIGWYWSVLENADYEFVETILSNYDSKENADYKFGETTLSNYDSNKNADCELGMT